MKPATRFSLFVLLVSAYCLPARSEVISYSLTFCENLDVLKDPTNTVLMANVSNLGQHSLMMQRTTPYFELRNTSESAQLTQFSMTIGDFSKNFDWAQLVEASEGVSHTLETVDAVMGGLSSDFLTISFTGLEPGGFVRFRMGISDDDPGAPFVQDYRAILFGLDPSELFGLDPNDLDSESSTDKALITVEFKSDNLTGQLEHPLPDFTSNANGWESVQPFQFYASGTMPVPEPSTYALAVCGLIALATFRRRRANRT